MINKSSMGVILQDYINMFYTTNEVELTIYDTGDVFLETIIDDIGKFGMAFITEYNFTKHKSILDMRITNYRKWRE